MQATENNVQAVQATLNTHQQELCGLRAEVTAMPANLGRSIQGAMKTFKDETASSFDDRFSRLEALLEKKMRTE